MQLVIATEQCEHRARTTANLVALRNAASGTGVTNWWTNGGDQIAFGRGSAAYVAFNRSDGALTRTFQTGLPAGTYCDVANGDPVTGSGGTSCTGPAYAVDASGAVTATVPANGVLALHAGARTSGGGTACGSVTVTFEAQATTYWGQNVFVTGNTAALGDWSPADEGVGGGETGTAVPLSPATYPVWRGTATLPAGTAVQYKYVKKDGAAVVWESDPNRTRTTPSTTPCTATWTDTWR